MTIKVEKATAPRGAGSSAPSASEPGITAAMMRPTAAMMRPLDILLRYQGDLLKAMEPEAMRWFARRQEDVQAGLNALERLSTSTDVETLVDVQRDWLRGAVERLQADLAALASRWTLPATTAASGSESTPQRETQTTGSTRTDERATTAA